MLGIFTTDIQLTVDLAVIRTKEIEIGKKKIFKWIDLELIFWNNEKTLLTMAVEQIVQGGVLSSPLLMPLLAIVAVLAAVHFWQMSRRERKIGDLLPGPPTIPIVGNAHYFINSSNHGKFLVTNCFNNSYFNQSLKVWKLIIENTLKLQRT